MKTPSAYSSSSSLAGSAGNHRLYTLGVCAAAALIEGFDTQAMGVAGPAIIREYGLNAGQASLLFGSGTLGMVLGATAGGRIADAISRRWALVLSMLLIGACSLATVAAATVPELIGLRALAGVGLGAAMPNFIALASEAVRPEHRLRTVTLLMAALPVGGTLASLTALANESVFGWRNIFILGGGVPLILATLCFLINEEPTPARDSAGSDQRHVFARTLFSQGRALTTLLLWASFFFTQLVLLLMLNWFPTLIVKSGFTPQQASWAQVVFSIGGIIGSLVVGTLQAPGRRRVGAAVTYLSISGALVLIALAQQAYWSVLLSALIAGIFVIGATLSLYAASSLYYARRVRATGVGAAVGVGRLGSVVGPLFAGVLLSGGGTTATVLLGLQPFVLVAGACAVLLCSRPEVHD